jgi:diguanylate cyclase (GGDEF)-like protein
MQAPSEIASTFSEVPLLGSMQETATACVRACRNVLAARVRLSIPAHPVPITVGDAEATLPLLGFAVQGGEAWLHVDDAAAPVAADAVATIRTQLQRIWQVQEDRAARSLDVDRLRFNLTALQQVARTLAVVRRTDETERLALDSVGEVFFAWWAALYRRSEDEYVRRAARTLRGDALPERLPAAVVDELGPLGPAPVELRADASLRRHVAAELALVELLDLGETAGLLMLGPRMNGEGYDPHDRALLRALADSSAVALRNAQLLDRLHAQAIIDPLTGCRNRRGFDELLFPEISRARRHGRPLSLLLLDLDHFKSVNDDHGHAAGDHALRRIGRILQTTFRVSDSACRYGGEEFAILLPETAKAEACHVAERLRAVIDELEPDLQLPRRLTASLGVASLPDDAADAAGLVSAADAALYAAKSGGRNRVCAA